MLASTPERGWLAGFFLARSWGGLFFAVRCVPKENYLSARHSDELHLNPHPASVQMNPPPPMRAEMFQPQSTSEASDKKQAASADWISTDASAKWK